MPPDPQDALLRLRADFPILDRFTYLVSHSLGAMPHAAAGELAGYGRDWAELGVQAWENGWWELPRTAGDELAPLLGAPRGTVVLQPGATLAAAVLLSCLDFEPPRDGLVTTSLEFPSLLYLYRGMADRGARITEVPSADDGAMDVERLCAAIDERTRVVCVSHVFFRSGALLDVDRVATRARDAGAHLFLDVYQSAGAVPLDLAALGADAAFGGCLKWLCGGPGAGFLYVRADRIPELSPRLTGWMGHAEPLAFDAGPLRRAAGIERFLHGTPAVPAYRAARAGIRILREAGIDAVRGRSLLLTDRILERCEAEGWKTRTPRRPGRRGGSVVFSPPSAEELARELNRRGFLVDHRPGGGIRMGPHFYNTDSEVDAALDETAAILRNRATVT